MPRRRSDRCRHRMIRKEKAIRMNERFLKVFKRYIPDEQSAAVMEQITDLLNIRSDTKSRIVTCDLAFGRIVPKKQLYHLASGIKEAYGLEKVELYPRYPSGLFCASYVEELVETICRTDGRIGRGFFDGCEYDFDENAQTVTIRLRDGVTAALLNSDGADAFFSQCVRYEFGRDVKFRILGELADMAEPQYVRDAKRRSAGPPKNTANSLRRTLREQPRTLNAPALSPRWRRLILNISTRRTRLSAAAGWYLTYPNRRR